MSIMWDMSSQAQVNSFIAALSPSDARDADSLVRIAVWESQEQQGDMDAYADHASAVIRTARGL